MELTIIIFWDIKGENLKLISQHYRAWSDCTEVAGPGSILVAKSNHFQFWQDWGMKIKLNNIHVFLYLRICIITFLHVINIDKLEQVEKL